MTRWFGLILAIWLPVATASSNSWLLEDVTLIDGTGSEPSVHMTVEIRDGLISAIYASGSRPAPEGLQVLEVRGKTIIPGLIDSHVHISPPPGTANWQAESAQHLSRVLAGGITSMRDMGGDAIVLGELAQMINQGKMVGPSLHYSAIFGGPSFFADPRTQASAHGGTAGEVPWLRALEAATNFHEVAAQAMATGARGAKFYGNLSGSLMPPLASAAHKMGLMVWSHGTVFPASPEDAVNAGVDVLSHTPYLIWQAEETIPSDYAMRKKGRYGYIAPDHPDLLALYALMAHQGTMLDATLYVFREDVAAQEGAPLDWTPASWAYKATSLAHEKGVSVVAGTDSVGAKEAGSLPNIHTELALLVEQSGLKPVTAIRAATLNGARALGLSAVKGSISKGKQADLVILNSNPERDIHNTRDIFRVLKLGVVYEAADSVESAEVMGPE
jgi:imidazolonepropionase-like amidohydrolase